MSETLTLDRGSHVSAVVDELGVLLASLTVQIFLMELFPLQLLDAPLQPVQLTLVQHQRLTQI